MIKIGIVGAGKVVQRAYLPGFAERGSELSKSEYAWFDFGGCDNAEVVSLCGKNIEEAKEFAVKYDIPHITENWQDVVNDKDIDAVCVATPNFIHAEISIAAAESGKHVLVDKPIAASLKEADAMIGAAKKNNVIIMMQQTFRFLPAVDVAYRLVNSGILGKIFSVKSNFCTPGPDVWAPGSDWFFSTEQAGYGAFLDVGIHAADLVRYLTGKNIKEVAAMGGTFIKNIELDDNLICVCRFEDDTVATIQASWTSVLDISAVINGEKGMLRLNFGDKKPLKLELASGSFTERTENGVDNKEIAGISGKFESGVFYPDIPSETEYRGPFQYFIDCIMNKEKPFVSGEEGRADLAIVLAGYRSMQERHFVSVI